MVESSICLILAYAIIVVQANQFSNINTNTNSQSNVFHRDYSGKLNNDLLNSRLPAYYDDDEILGKLQADVDPQIASVAVAAAEEAMKIVKMFTDELSESIGVGVAEAVVRTLTDRGSRGLASRSNRRNANYNSNSNMNIIGHSRPTSSGPITDEENDRIPSSDLMELGSGLGSILGLGSGPNSDELGSSASDYPSETSEALRSRGTGGIYPDDENENGADKTTLGENVAVDDSLEDDDATLSPKPVGSLGRDRPSRQNSNTNFNSNVNSNLRRAFRRNANSNVNTNTNTFQRDTNSNTNTNTHRRNLNSNGNINRINRGSRYRRD